ncbi:hypothetical protein H9X86_11815, partial [Pseudoflavonifractor capillosus]|nr:hypothetical protein [Pseudoflavonifractor capillosus]
MSKKKHKKSNPHSAPKAKPTQPSKNINPLVWGIGGIVVVAVLVVAAVLLIWKPT